ncbi:dehydrogenase/reductase SDR family member 9-like [Amblyomma americanum]
MQSALLICAGLLFPVRLLCLRVPVLSEAAAFLGTWILTLVCSYWLACFIWSKTLRKAVSTEGKAVLVTGCDTGFGHHAAKRFAQDGFTVFAGCLNAASDGAKELATRANVHVLQLDITSDDQVYKALDEVKKSLGSNDLWAVLANAGVTGMGLVEWNSIERVKHIFEVNVFGHVRVVKAFLPLLKKSRGRLVIVTSGLCRVTIPGTTVYCMSKHAMLSLVDGLRRECEEAGVDVAAVEPTAYRTNMIENIGSPKYIEADLKRLPDEVKELIPEDSVGRWAKFTGGMFDLITRDNPMEVVDQMNLAVTDVRPRPCYRAMTLQDKFCLLFVKLFPDEVLDVFFTLFRAMVQFVK